MSQPNFIFPERHALIASLASLLILLALATDHLCGLWPFHEPPTARIIIGEPAIPEPPIMGPIIDASTEQDVSFNDSDCPPRIYITRYWCEEGSNVVDIDVVYIIVPHDFFKLGEVAVGDESIGCDGAAEDINPPIVYQPASMVRYGIIGPNYR
ncbi:hypothetical protein FJZ48_00210 [Candidatus Uhrbacteria bacterium]|nr:hypothetical protein [Candidatus Uhrbacteria bacterium]